MRRSRMGGRQRVGIGAVLTVALVAGAAPVPAAAAALVSGACRCVTSDDADLKRADVVFKGTLDGSTSSASTDRMGNTQESGLVHQFTPTTVYKGDVTIPQYVIEPPDRDPSCSVDWSGPGPYLVFAERPKVKEKKTYQLNDSDLILRACSGTTAIDADDEPSFGPGRPAVAPAPPAPAPAPAEPTAPAEPESPDNWDGGGLSVDNLLGDLLEALLGLGSDDSPDR